MLVLTIFCSEAMILKRNEHLPAGRWETLFIRILNPFFWALGKMYLRINMQSGDLAKQI